MKFSHIISLAGVATAVPTISEHPARNDVAARSANSVLFSKIKSSDTAVGLFSEKSWHGQGWYYPYFDGCLAFGAITVAEISIESIFIYDHNLVCFLFTDEECVNAYGQEFTIATEEILAGAAALRCVFRH